MSPVILQYKLLTKPEKSEVDKSNGDTNHF